MTDTPSPAETPPDPPTAADLLWAVNAILDLRKALQQPRPQTSFFVSQQRWIRELLHEAESTFPYEALLPFLEKGAAPAAAGPDPRTVALAEAMRSLPEIRTLLRNLTEVAHRSSNGKPEAAELAQARGLLHVLDEALG